MKEFKIYAYEILDKKFKGDFKYSEKKSVIDQLLADRTTRLFGITFYKVMKELNQDLDKACNILFKNHKCSKLIDDSISKNPLGSLVKKHSNSQREIGEAAGIEKARFNRLINGKNNEAYANEVYGLAIALNLKPSEVFEKFYNDL